MSQQAGVSVRKAINLVSSRRAYENGPLYSSIALIDLNDPYMILTEGILDLIPAWTKRGVMLLWVTDGQHRRRALVYYFHLNEYGSAEKNLFNLMVQRTSLYINGDELIRTHFVSEAWPAFIGFSVLHRIRLSTGFSTDKIRITGYSLRFIPQPSLGSSRNGDIVLNVRGTMNTLGRYTHVHGLI